MEAWRVTMLHMLVCMACDCEAYASLRACGPSECFDCSHTETRVGEAGPCCSDGFGCGIALAGIADWFVQQRHTEVRCASLWSITFC